MATKITELIYALNEILEKYGDLPISDEFSDVGEGANWVVSVNNKDGLDVLYRPETEAIEVLLESREQNK